MSPTKSIYAVVVSKLDGTRLLLIPHGFQPQKSLNVSLVRVPSVNEN